MEQSHAVEANRPRRRGPTRRAPETRAYTLLLEPEIAEAAKRNGSLSELVRTLLRVHHEHESASSAAHATDPTHKRRLTGRGFLAGEPGSVDDFIARKAQEKELEH